jgi:hypothetical protein
MAFVGENQKKLHRRRPETEDQSFGKPAAFEHRQQESAPPDAAPDQTVVKPRWSERQRDGDPNAPAMSYRSKSQTAKPLLRPPGAPPATAVLNLPI